MDRLQLPRGHTGGFVAFRLPDDAFATTILFWVPPLLDADLERGVCALLDEVLDAHGVAPRQGSRS